MSKKLPPIPIRDFVRTPLFWLLYDHHAELSETWRGSRVRWPVVCAWATASGVTDREGRPLQPGAVKMCWRRVCAAKVEEQAEQTAKPTPAPVRSPVVNRVPAMPQSAPAQRDDSVAERMALMTAKINQRSGRY